MTRTAERGVSLLALMVAVAIMSVALMAALPGWKYVIQDDREQELLFRGNEIARAIERYQAKNNGAVPTTLEVLVKGKFLRRAYKDPFAKDGNWKRIAPGQMLAPPGGGDAGREGLGRSVLSQGAPQPPTGVGAGSGEFGAIAGVATTKKGESLRIFNGRSRYEEWTFVAGQPRVVGRGTGVPNAPGVNSPNSPNSPKTPSQPNNSSSPDPPNN